jgi:glutaredoxin
MCKEAVDFFEENGIEYTEYLTSDEIFNEKLEEYKSEYGDESEGVSTSYRYYPMIFYKDKAFSGFNDSIKETILSL